MPASHPRSSLRVSQLREFQFREFGGSLEGEGGLWRGGVAPKSGLYVVFNGAGGGGEAEKGERKMKKRKGRTRTCHGDGSGSGDRCLHGNDKITRGEGRAGSHGSFACPDPDPPRTATTRIQRVLRFWLQNVQRVFTVNSESFEGHP